MTIVLIAKKRGSTKKMVEALKRMKPRNEKDEADCLFYQDSLASEVEPARELPARARPLPDAPLFRDFVAFKEHLQNIYTRLGRDILPKWHNLPVRYKGIDRTPGASGYDVAILDHSENSDFDSELAAIIGRGGANIEHQNTLYHAYGYTIYSNFTARDIQGREMSVELRSAKDEDLGGANVFEPVLVTQDEISDGYTLSMEAKLNDADRSQSNTSKVHRRLEEIIAQASRRDSWSRKVLRLGDRGRRIRGGARPIRLSGRRGVAQGRANRTLENRVV